MVNQGSRGTGEAKLETIISYVLIIGVIVSFIALSIGLAAFYYLHGSWSINQSPSAFVQSENFFLFVMKAVGGSTPSSFAVRMMSLGAAILILTPYIRAVLSAIYFAAQRDFKYLVFTLFVLAVLTWSLAVH